MKKTSKVLGFLGVVLSLAVLSNAQAAESNKFDVRVSPFVLMIGAVDAEVNIKVTPNVTVAPMFTYWSISGDVTNTDLDMTLTGYGVRAYWHPDAAFRDGFYISPFYRYFNFSATGPTDIGTQGEGSVGAHEFGATAGYMWQWDNFNLNLGAGYGAFKLGDFVFKDSSGYSDQSSSDSIPAMGGLVYDLTMGYAF